MVALENTADRACRASGGIVRIFVRFRIGIFSSGDGRFADDLDDRYGSTYDVYEIQEDSRRRIRIWNVRLVCQLETWLSTQ